MNVTRIDLKVFEISCLQNWSHTDRCLWVHHQPPLYTTGG